MIHIFSNVYVCEFAPFTVGVGFARFGVMCMWLVWMSTQQTTQQVITTLAAIQDMGGG